jgi:S-disulfanyl-L-cysteine oxidoreductase SoxD
MAPDMINFRQYARPTLEKPVGYGGFACRMGTDGNRERPGLSAGVEWAAMNCRLRWTGALSAVTVLFLGLASEGRSGESLWDDLYRSAWAGIYRTDQAAQGESFYRARCAACHGASLEGSEDAPPLSGRDFTQDWDWGNMADLFEKIQYTMPANRPGRLSENQVAEVLSYILQVNRFPAGSSALPPSADDLRGVLFLAQKPRR